MLGSVMKRSSVVFIVMLVASVCGPMFAYAAQSTPNKITFDNQSGQNAVVKLIGPTKIVTKLARDQKRMVRATAGNYYVLVRYGNSPKEYSYSKSAPFSVTQPDNRVSIITFTLHRRSGGSFQSHPVSGDEFERVNTTNMESTSPTSP